MCVAGPNSTQGAASLTIDACRLWDDDAQLCGAARDAAAADAAADAAAVAAQGPLGRLHDRHTHTHSHVQVSDSPRTSPDGASAAKP